MKLLVFTLSISLVVFYVFCTDVDRNNSCRLSDLYLYAPYIYSTGLISYEQPTLYSFPNVYPSFSYILSDYYPVYYFYRKNQKYKISVLNDEQKGHLKIKGGQLFHRDEDNKENWFVHDMKNNESMTKALRECKKIHEDVRGNLMNYREKVKHQLPSFLVKILDLKAKEKRKEKKKEEKKEEKDLKKAEKVERKNLKAKKAAKKTDVAKEDDDKVEAEVVKSDDDKKETIQEKKDIKERNNKLKSK